MWSQVNCLYVKSFCKDTGLGFNDNQTCLCLAAMKKIFERDFFSKYLIHFVNVNIVCIISEVFQHFSNWCNKCRKDKSNDKCSFLEW